MSSSMVIVGAAEDPLGFGFEICGDKDGKVVAGLGDA